MVKKTITKMQKMHNCVNSTRDESEMVWTHSIFVKIIAVLVIAVLLTACGASSPYKQVLAAIEQQQYKEALKIFDANRVEINAEEKSNITESLLRAANDLKQAYVDGNSDYESTCSALRELKQWGFSEVSSFIKEAEEELASIHSSRVQLEDGKELIQKRDYIGAIQVLSGISDADESYREAQQLIDEAINTYRNELVSDATEYAGRNEYIKAIALLREGLTILENDSQLLSEIDSYKDQYVGYVSENVRALSQNSQYPEAIQLIGEARQAVQDDRFDELYANCVSDYVSAVVSSAEALANAGDMTHAIEAINEALAVVPDNPTLLSALEEYNWTMVLYSDSNYTIVRKDKDTFDSHIIQVGIMDSNGKWIVPLSSEFVFAQAIQNESGRATLTGSRTAITDDNVYYLGEGAFIMSLGVKVRSASGYLHDVGSNYSTGSEGLKCYFYNVKNGAQASFNAVWISNCSDGNMLMYNSSRYNSNFYRVDTSGNVFELPVRHEVNDYPVSGLAEGLFYANGYFYDIEGNKVIDLTQYAIISAPYFSNGKCTFEFKNNMGTRYKATIDKTGEFISAPEMVNN